MTTEQIKELVRGEEYDFLRTNPHLAGRIIFLTLGGSHAYGTNIATSDVDIRGCALNRPQDILGSSVFEQVTNTQTDTTVYSFNKLISLLVSCNPNTIEMLGCKPEHYIEMTDIGREMIENRKMFLSRRAVNSFGGYATQQLRRLENALARDRLPQARAQEHVRDALERSMKSFGDRYTSFENGGITLFTADSKRTDIDREVFCNIHIDGYPAKEFSTLLNTLSSVVGNYEKLNHRNHKKDENHLDKHAMHLIRLYLTGLDILENEEICTYREKDLALLRSVRRGDYRNKDGTYKPEFFEMVEQYERRLKYAAENTSLPNEPDLQRIEDFKMSVNRRALYAA